MTEDKQANPPRDSEVRLETFTREDLRRGTILPCGCCGRTYNPRGDDDPWQGRMDAYCETCADARCDAFPGDCRRLAATDQVLRVREWRRVWLMFGWCLALGRVDRNAFPASPDTEEEGDA